jgi:scyllo-inositol 2-dehydrogenase (NADP+)
VISVGVVGLGKMGISHLSMINAHPDVTVAGVCDTSGYLLSVLGKYTGLQTFGTMEEMLDALDLDAVVISTPSAFHADLVRSALTKGLHVFCEKPLCLDPADSQELAALADERGLVTQVGYHNRFVGAFQEVKRLLDAGAIGTVTHVLAEAYGPVVLKPKGATWRTQRTAGGGCLYDYAAHPLDLLTWYFGAPIGVGGTRLGKVFSRETDDEVASTIYYPGELTAQLSVSWSDDSQRKMTTKITAWGTRGRIHADRQEVEVYLREGDETPAGYTTGWNVRYTTELTEPVWFYVRGEEYSAQLDSFVTRVAARRTEGENTFQSAAITDAIIAAMVQDDEVGPRTLLSTVQAAPAGRPASERKGRSGLRRFIPTR